MAKRTKKHMRQPEAIEPDVFADEFFSQPPVLHAVDTHWDEPEERPTLAPDKQRAMFATLAIFGLFATALGGFVVYTQWIMPTPVALNASAATFALPTAAAYEATPVATAAAPTTSAPTTSAPTATATLTAPTTLTAAADEQEQQVVAHAPAPALLVIEPPAAKRVTPPKPNATRAATTTVDKSSLGAQAMRALNSGRASDARHLAQQVVQQSPESADGWIVLGAAHDALGDHAAAMTAYATCTTRAFGPRVAICKALAR